MAPPQNSPGVIQHLGAGISLAGSVLICTGIGYAVDRHWGTNPWGVLVGAFLGIGAGLYNFIREFTDDSSTSSSKRI